MRRFWDKVRMRRVCDTRHQSRSSRVPRALRVLALAALTALLLVALPQAAFARDLSAPWVPNPLGPFSMKLYDMDGNVLISYPDGYQATNVSIENLSRGFIGEFWYPHVWPSDPGEPSRAGSPNSNILLFEGGVEQNVVDENGLWYGWQPDYRYEQEERWEDYITADGTTERVMVYHKYTQYNIHGLQAGRTYRYRFTFSYGVYDAGENTFIFHITTAPGDGGSDEDSSDLGPGEGEGGGAGDEDGAPATESDDQQPESEGAIIDSEHPTTGQGEDGGNTGDDPTSDKNGAPTTENDNKQPGRQDEIKNGEQSTTGNINGAGERDPNTEGSLTPRATATGSTPTERSETKPLEPAQFTAADDPSGISGYRLQESVSGGGTLYKVKAGMPETAMPLPQEEVALMPNLLLNDIPWVRVMLFGALAASLPAGLLLRFTRFTFGIHRLRSAVA